LFALNEIRYCQTEGNLQKGYKQKDTKMFGYFNIFSFSKKADSARGYRKRGGEALFIDARKIGLMISRKQKELLSDDIALIDKIYHSWRCEHGSAGVSPALGCGNAGGTPALPPSSPNSSPENSASPKLKN